jgi:hypothetical protein
MANLSTALTQLRREQEEAQQQVIQLGHAIQAIEKIVSRETASSQHSLPTSAKTIMSEETRRRLSIAQKARWAAKKPAQSVVEVNQVPAAKRTMSAAARKKISLALRARWAKVKSTAKKAA